MRREVIYFALKTYARLRGFWRRRVLKERTTWQYSVKGKSICEGNDNPLAASVDALVEIVRPFQGKGMSVPPVGRDEQ